MVRQWLAMQCGCASTSSTHTISLPQVDALSVLLVDDTVLLAEMVAASVVNGFDI